MLNATRQKAVVKPGGVIELKTADLPIGTEVEVTFRLEPAVKKAVRHPLEGLTPEEIQARLDSMPKWEDEEDIIKIFAEIDRERHADFGREIPEFES